MICLAEHIVELVEGQVLRQKLVGESVYPDQAFVCLFLLIFSLSDGLLRLLPGQAFFFFFSVVFQGGQGCR